MRTAKPGWHVLYVDRENVRNALIVNAFSDENPHITLLFVEAGQPKFKVFVPHMKRRAESYQPYWCWPEELPSPEVTQPESELEPELVSAGGNRGKKPQTSRR